MSEAAILRRSVGPSPTDRYFTLLAYVLLGYAVLGKGFAYLGAPPLFVGEATLALGVVAFLWTGCYFAVFTTLPSLLLAAFMMWVVVRTFPYIGTYGIEALRDSVVVVYGVYAFVVIALLLEKPSRINHVFRYFQSFTGIFGACGGLLYLSKIGHGWIPAWPNSGVPILYLRGGEVAVHLAGAAVFAILGLRRVSMVWIILLFAGICLVAAQSRGGMLAMLIPIIMAFVAGGKIRQLGVVLLAAVLLLCLAYVTNVRVELPGDERLIGAEQVLSNAASTVGQSNDAGLDGTKLWRLRWWDAIQNYTLWGDFFWTGKGFGVNLAEADGFVVSEDPNAPPLRSPHSVHMTILARAGVPGLCLWILTGTAWVGMLAHSAIVARRRGETTWANFFVFLVCYLAAIVIDASFDVALEGPILGIWFWVLFGIGVGASMIYQAQRAEQRLRSQQILQPSA